MKKFRKLSILTLASVLLFTSCETLDLDLTSNPNALGPDHASAALFITALQEDIAYFVAGLCDP